MDIIKCIIKMFVFLLFQKIQGMILDNQLIDGNNGIAGEVAYLPLFDFLKKNENLIIHLKILFKLLRPQL